MLCCHSEFPTDWDSCRVYILSDLHIGDPNADMATIHERIQRIADDPHGVCILNGDLMNTAVRAGVSDIYGEILSPMEEIKLAVDLLTPIKDRIVAATTGNHEARTYKSDGIDMTRLICRELGVEDKYAPEGVLCFLSFGNKTHQRSGNRAWQPIIYSIYASHGTGGGRKEGSKAIRLADMASIVDADCYIHSHSHLPLIMKQSFYRVALQNRTVKAVDKLFVNDASALNYGGYGQSYEYKPNSIQSPVIHLCGTKRALSATL